MTNSVESILNLQKASGPNHPKTGTGGLVIIRAPGMVRAMRHAPRRPITRLLTSNEMSAPSLRWS